jgi:cold shock CspA family protein
VLIISDTDYVPLMRKLQALGVRTMLLAWEFEYTNDDGVHMVTKTSHELLQLATYPISMHSEIENGLAEGDSSITGLFVDTESFSREETVFPNVAPGELQTSQILSIKNGFGFVRYPNNNLFFHQLDVIGDFADLEPGDTVEFTIDKNAMKQDVAKNVRKISEPEDAEQKETLS